MVIIGAVGKTHGTRGHASGRSREIPRADRPEHGRLRLVTTAKVLFVLSPQHTHTNTVAS